jgi:hypothetical protein
MENVFGVCYWVWKNQKLLQVDMALVYLAGGFSGANIAAMVNGKAILTDKGIKNPRSKAPGYLRFFLEIFAYVGEQIPHTPSIPPQGAEY